jgi:hypothetical protein
MAARSKQGLPTKKGFVLLTDLAHNLLAGFDHRTLLVSSRVADYSPKPIARDLLTMQGRLAFEAGKLQRIELPNLKQSARDLLLCLERYCLGDYEPPLSAQSKANVLLWCKIRVMVEFDCLKQEAEL